MNTAFIRVSGNEKTGPIPVSTSDAKTCPDACPLKSKGCYAKSGPISWHWKKVDKNGEAWEDFLSMVAWLPKGQLWRHNQAGDLPGIGDKLDTKALGELVAANKGKKGFTYTHKPLEQAKERKAVEEANEKGFTINLSANSLTHADELKALGIRAPIVAIVPDTEPTPKKTPAGNPVVECLHTSHGLQCAQCGLCAVPNRKSIVAFRAHGVSKKHVNLIAK